ncbi:MAG: ABC-F family ATP-binding cassette domain-containing protein [Dysgonomonas sp.]
MSIIIKQITYIHPDRESLFQNISFSLAKGQKVALIGNNGTGKSTLLRIIAGNLQAASGEIIYQEHPYYIPQHFGQYDKMTVAEALHIDKKIVALNDILKGNASAENFSLLNDEWDIEDRATAALSKWNLDHITLFQRMDSLSGGEKTKVFLSGIYIHNPSVILFDEPSNHLDKESRKQLYELMQNSNATIIVVSHDRTLLNLLDLTYELSADKVEVYGGNYEFYKQQKEEKMYALQAQFEEKQKELRKARNIAREVAEKKQRRDVRGKKKAIKEGIPRIMMNTIRNKAETSTAKLNDMHTNKMDGIVADIKQIKQQLPDKKDLKMDFEDMSLHSGKILITAKGVNFGYSDKVLWQEALEFQIRSGDRLVISGQNGAGKTTLLKLILGQLEPTKGTISRAHFRYLYIDQDYSLIDNGLTVFDQVQQFNSRKLTDDELRVILHRFLFTYEMWNKTCDKLSGGEKMRLIFCCMQIDDNAPDMFILDEPANNLDIQSLEIVTNSIRDYKGTLLIISHDAYFIKEVEVDKEIILAGG